MFTGKTRNDYPSHFIDTRLECKKSPLHRLGVFAKEPIPNRTLIEACPVIVFDKETHDILKGADDLGTYYRAYNRRHILLDYPFSWDPSTNVIALGWGGIYNHSTLSPNVKWQPNHNTESLDFYAKRDIEAGEELLVRYLPVDQIDKLWFVEEETEHMLGTIEYADNSSNSFRDLARDVKKL